ncbi:nuclear transcription factor Y subunit C-3-like [Abrus precatorius]|uniref:Nuclear transcription factor Y subunit C-3-like n=1 Tax=Abrus precatorius TaxID=3816 RepID=A0A8B8L801_ABRPR|nr:nuclear transcription factor Y subunit C-3-like [Abrus precatorius]
MDFNSNSVSSNLPPNSMPMPPYPMDQYRQEETEVEKLRLFWQEQLFSIQSTQALRSQQPLPLARIRRIIKTDSGVQMISAETPILMAKACEIFIQELTFRAWMLAEESNKRTVKPCDIAKAILQTEVFHFLSDVVPSDLLRFCAFDTKHEENAGNIAEGSQASLPHPAGLMGNPMMNMGSDQVARNHLIPQSYMMQPPFMPSDQLPYNCHTKSK